MRRQHNRSGYAMLLVLAFLVIFFSLLSLAFSQLAALVRAETVRANESQRDQGSAPALARALALLETGYPPSNPYACGATVDTPTGPSEYTVTFSSPAAGSWTIHVTPTADGESPAPMPLLFTSQTPP